MAAFEMALGGWRARGLGLQVPISALGATAPEARLYSEAPGFLYEVSKERLTDLLALLARHEVDATMIGRTLAEPRFRVLDGGRTLIDADLNELAALHAAPLRPLVE